MLVAYIQCIQQNQVHTPAAVLDKMTPTVISLLWFLDIVCLSKSQTAATENDKTSLESANSYLSGRCPSGKYSSPSVASWWGKPSSRGKSADSAYNLMALLSRLGRWRGHRWSLVAYKRGKGMGCVFVEVQDRWQVFSAVSPGAYSWETNVFSVCHRPLENSGQFKQHCM